MKTGILVHGRHLQTKNWEEMMWGSPPDVLGQLPLTVLVALEEEPEIILFGSGASELNGEKEAVYTKNYLLRRFLALAEFREFQKLVIDLAKTKDWLENISEVILESQNTSEEVACAGRIFESRGIERVIALTSPTHAPRCLNEAIKFYSRPESKIAVHDVSVLSSDLGWASNKEVVILEPPHRPDDQTGKLRMKIAKLLLQPDNLAKIEKALGL